jgi:hypothetical protein
MKSRTIQLIIFACLYFFSNSFAHSYKHASTIKVKSGIDVRVKVYDAKEKFPIGLAEVVLQQSGEIQNQKTKNSNMELWTNVIAQGETSTGGIIWFKDIQPGSYKVIVWAEGYKISTNSVVVDQKNNNYSFGLLPFVAELGGVEVLAQREPRVSNNINMQTGNQTFDYKTYHSSPSMQMTNLIQQNVMGAARAPTGEVHVRGQHGEYSYYIDGIPLPLGVFGGLNEVVDPKVINSATFITGGFPAEYGGQTSAIIVLNNRVPTGAFHLDATTYFGSYLVFNRTKPFSPGAQVASGQSSSATGDTLGGRVGPFRALNSDGQSLSISNHLGNFGYYVSGSRQETDRRVDTPVPNLFHDHGFDYFLYGKFDYIISDYDYITANLNFGLTNTQIPYDPSVQIMSDIQKTTNSLQSLSYFREVSTETNREANLFIGAYTREGGLIYTPGDIDPLNFQFAADTNKSYRLAEDRNFSTFGIRSTFDKNLTQNISIKIGTNISYTMGSDDFSSFDSLNNMGPTINSNFVGSDFGAFAETQLKPFPWTSFNFGLRYDQQIAPDNGLQSQFSPRIRWNFLIDDNNYAYLYFGRLFMPPNIELLRAIAENVSYSETPTFPERCSYYEAVFIHKFPFYIKMKTDAFYYYASPFMDDATIGNTAISTPFNISIVKTTGIELGLTYSNPSMPFSGHINSSIIHAVGFGKLTGGFLPPSTDGPGTDLDHDQRISLEMDANYQPESWFVNLETSYGSGLSNGHPEDVSNYGTRLFDFNQAAHVTPYWIVDLSTGHTFQIDGSTSLETSIYVNNLFNHIHLIKGAYTTGASWEEPRNVVFKIGVHI